VPGKRDKKFNKIHNERNPDDNQDFIANPDLIVSNVKYGIESAFIWWHMNNMNSICTGDTDDIVKNVTTRVNGRKCLGLDDRKKNFKKILKIINSE